MALIRLPEEEAQSISHEESSLEDLLATVLYAALDVISFFGRFTLK
jgi:hypothetical protein